MGHCGIRALIGQLGPWLASDWLTRCSIVTQKEGETLVFLVITMTLFTLLALVSRVIFVKS